MIPDHARALRTSAVLAILAVFPPFFIGLAMLHMGWWWSGAALIFTMFCLIGIAVRAGTAFDRLRQRHLPRAMAGAVMLGCALAIYPAAAQQPRTETLARAGAWSAFVSIGQNGTPICGMDAHAGDRHFLVKRIGAARHLTLHVARPSWNIPTGTRIRATMAIGGRSWTGTGTAMSATLIEWTLTDGAIDDFMVAFRGGLELRLSFHQGSEAPWSVSLIGTNAMSAAFLGCINAQNEALRAPPAPTQPFSSSQAPVPSPAPAPGGRERRT